METNGESGTIPAKGLRLGWIIVALLCVLAGGMSCSKAPPPVPTGPVSPDVAIEKNLYLLSAAADQYYLKHGVETVTYDNLVGPEPEKSVKSITPVAGEDYTKLMFKKGQGLSVSVNTATSGLSVQIGHIPHDDYLSPTGRDNNLAVKSIQSSAAAFVDNGPSAFRAEFTNIKRAADALPVDGGSPTSKELLALHAATDKAIQAAKQISASDTESAATKAEASELATTLQAFKDTVSYKFPAK